MTSELDIDPALFGDWREQPVYDGARRGGDGERERLEQAAWRIVLDTKAEVSPLDALQDMLNGMTRELREQLQQFQMLRTAADKMLAAGEEIDRKQTQADAKASVEAMSVIVRTLEKIDSLQRTIAHDRQAQAERDTDEAGYQALVAEFNDRVERRAAELLAGGWGKDDAGRSGEAGAEADIRRSG